MAVAGHDVADHALLSQCTADLVEFKGTNGQWPLQTKFDVWLNPSFISGTGGKNFEECWDLCAVMVA